MTNSTIDDLIRAAKAVISGSASIRLGQEAGPDVMRIDTSPAAWFAFTKAIAACEQQAQPPVELVPLTKAFESALVDLVDAVRGDAIARLTGNSDQESIDFAMDTLRELAKCAPAQPPSDAEIAAWSKRFHNMDWLAAVNHAQTRQHVHDEAVALMRRAAAAPPAEPRASAGLDAHRTKEDMRAEIDALCDENESLMLRFREAHDVLSRGMKDACNPQEDETDETDRSRDREPIPIPPSEDRQSQGEAQHRDRGVPRAGEEAARCVPGRPGVGDSHDQAGGGSHVGEPVAGVRLTDGRVDPSAPDVGANERALAIAELEAAQASLPRSVDRHDVRRESWNAAIAQVHADLRARIAALRAGGAQGGAS